MLVAHEAAWRMLSWSDSASVDVLVGCGEPVSVSGNVLGFRTNPGIPHQRQELLLLRVPSKLRNVTGKFWRIQLLDDIQDICIDSAQDLLVCRCGYVTCSRIPPSHSYCSHSRFKSFGTYSLLTGRSHPLAQHVGVLDATSTWRYRIGSMRVCGDNLAVASEQGMYIIVWNWKSGEHISDFVCFFPIQMERYPIFLTAS
jgi:hypothetical protein